MGIDAQMLVRIPSEVSDPEILEVAVALHSCFRSYVVVPHRAYRSFYKEGSEAFEDRSVHCLHRVDEYIQDGPFIYPEPGEGETLLEVELSGRYYGEHYERGPIYVFIAIADFLELQWPEADIWYGGDSSGVLAKPFPKKERRRLFRHFAQVAHEPYESAFDLDGDTDTPVCDLCRIPLYQSGWGSGQTLWHCAGCGAGARTESGEETVWDNRRVGFREKEAN